MRIKLLLTIVLLFSIAVGYSQTMEDLNFLQGTWKAEDKETYEVWRKTDKEFKGSAYKIRNGEKIITETLSLKNVNGEIVYEATVPDQNAGKPIPFTLTSSSSKEFTFENQKHDFPTRIIYQKVNDSQLIVQVLGADDKGFTIKFTKQ